MKHLSLLTALILFLSACGPVPTTSTDQNNSTHTSFDYPPIEDNNITEPENANSNAVNNLENDQVEPSLNIDGDTAELAPPFGDPPPDIDLGNGTVQRSSNLEANCRLAQGYKHGNPHTICVVTVQGKLVEVNTAAAFQRMAAAARADGVTLVINSGFRTMNQQRYLYDLYLRGVGNLAAYPGYSNHQSGSALDLGRSANAWLNAHAAAYNFFRTVPTEDWHWEWSGGRALLSANPDGCFSATLNRYVPVDTCVQSRADTHWYTCWGNGSWNAGMLRCGSTFPLTVIRPQTVSTTCYSTTLVREVPLNTCVRNQYDHQAYMCSMTGQFTTGWINSPGRC